MISPKHAAPARVSVADERQIRANTSPTAKRKTISGKASGHDTLRRVRQAKRSPAMKPMAGLWIDRRKAVIAIITSHGDTILEIDSDVEHEPSRFAGVQSTTTYESQLVKSDDSHQRDFSNRIKQFYDKVITAIADTESILIFGPGEAKGELKKLLGTSKSEHRLIAVETSGAMSRRQMMAKIHAHFHV